MSLLKGILKLAAPTIRIEKLDRFLFIGPHPDDIEIGAGATVAKLAKAGRKIRFVIALDGRYGLANAPSGTAPEQLIEIRKKEAISSAKDLGVEDVVFLGLSDGTQYTQDDLLSSIAKAVGDFNPQVVFSPDPCVVSECHQDHINVGMAVREISCFAAYPAIMEKFNASQASVKAVAFYMTSKPNQYIRSSNALLNSQIKAIFENHISQFPSTCDEARNIPMYLRLRSFFFGLRCLSAHAEGFRVLDQTHMHCMPEA